MGRVKKKRGNFHKGGGANQFHSFFYSFKSGVYNAFFKLFLLLLRWEGTFPHFRGEISTLFFILPFVQFNDMHKLKVKNLYHRSNENNKIKFWPQLSVLVELQEFFVVKFTGKFLNEISWTLLDTKVESMLVLCNKISNPLLS